MSQTLINAASIRNILISGAGAAGQSLAFWLRRYGFRPTVIERARAPRIGGFAIDLRGTALVAAERMGVIDACRAARVHMQEIARLDQDGEVVFKTDGNFGAGEAASGDIEILRDDLTAILQDAIDDDVEYIFGDSIEALDEDENGVAVRLRSGIERRFDLVIGADGLHSNVRSLVFGPESRFAHPLGMYVGIFTLPNLLDMDRQWWMSYLPKKSVNIMQYGRDKHTRSMFIFQSPPVAYDKVDTDQQKAVIEAAFHGCDNWVIPQILDALRDADDLYFDEVSQIRMDRWSKGRVALLGDAACAPTLMSGQGTSVALVGAYVLAGELMAARGDYRTAFERYEKAFRPYAEKNQGIALGNDEFAMPETWEELKAANERLRSGLGVADNDEPVATSAAALMQDAANAIDLKDYATA